MQNPHQQNGYQPYTNGAPAQAQPSGRRAWLRTPTVSEALPFTPFSSIVPFNPEVIPAPLVVPAHSANFGLGDHTSARRVLEQLSAGATSAENASKRCQMTLNDVQKLLDPEALTQYTFKKPKRFSPLGGNPTSSQFKKPVLSAFAKMALDGSNVSYRYLTPESSGAPLAPTVNGRKKSSHQPKLQTPESDTKVKALQQQVGAPASPNSYLEPSSQTLQAVVPTMLTPAQRAEYEYIADSITVTERQAAPAIGGRHLTYDQRQKSDIALRELQALLRNIWEAEQQINSGMSGERGLDLFTLVDSDDGPVPILQQATQETLDNTIMTVAKCGRLDGISVEQLVHAQKLCERTVSLSSSRNLQIGDDWSEEDIQDWQQKLAQTNGGLLAARTLLRIMAAGRQEKELQSEDLVRTVLEMLRNAIETGLIPVVEERSFVGEKIRGGDKPQANPKYAMAIEYQDSLRNLLHSITKSLRLLSGLLTKVEVDEVAISGIVSMAKSLIFAENASSEKDSVLGIQSVESTRKYAMDVLARIFTRYLDQRQFVIDEILMSLEKLPATKQSARQFKVPGEKPIQLVSALLMRLVQTSATRTTTALHLRSKPEEEDEDADGSDEDMEDESKEEEDDGDSTSSPNKGRGPARDLASLIKPLQESAQQNANYIVRILVRRALNTAKNSDEPYRKLLDIFTEDFLLVLGSSVWPSAELILRALLTTMITIAENHKNPQASRNLALEMLGIMGSGILHLQIQARSAVRNIDVNESDIASKLVRTFEQVDSGDLDNSAMLGFNGPFRVVLEYLHSRDNGNDAQLQTARGYHLVQWAHLLCNDREGSVDSEYGEGFNGTKGLQAKIRSMILDAQWLEAHHDFPAVTTATGRLAANLVTLNATFCRAFQRLFSVLLKALNDDHPTVKSRSLKSVVAILEQDPSVLDRNTTIMGYIFRCATDISSLVRESALKLISKCITLRPALEKSVYEAVIVRTHDAQIQVRKTAMKMLKDIYLRNDSPKMRSAIANAIISRIQDSDETVTEVARVIMEEIWFMPFHGLNINGENAVQVKLQYRSQAALLIQTIELGESVLRVLESLLREMVTKSKTAPANTRVCQTLIDVLFDGIIDPADIPDSPSQDLILETLTVFAKSCPILINASHLERLEPYTQNLATEDDLAVYRSVLAILRHTMPHVRTLRPDFLKKLQLSLMNSVSKLPKSEISEVAACLWTIDGELHNTERLVNLVASGLANIRAMSGEDLSSDPKKLNRSTKLMNIVGQFGKACDLEEQLETFKTKLKQPKAKSVSGLAIEVLCTFTTPKQPIVVRETSLEAICAICQRWPKQFLRADVTNAFVLILKDHVPSLEHIFLSGLEGFFATQDVPADRKEADESGPTGRERLETTYVANDQDGASSALAQRFLKDILRLALASHDDLALTATKLIASILQQGLPHPKECGPSLVALETSPNAAIARLAFAEHRVMHQKHETTIEKEYIRAVQQSFIYQKSVVHNLAGFVGSPPTSKLKYFWEVLKNGKVKVRHKFIANICQKLEFDPIELDVSGAATSQLLFSRYCCENLAFFDYDRTDDLLLVLSSLDKTFAGVGTALAQSIESDVMKLLVDGSNLKSIVNMDPIPETTPNPTSFDPVRLKTLAVSSQILLIIQETRSYVQRLWNLQKLVKKGKAAVKETSKNPTRATNAPALTEAYLKNIERIVEPRETPETQRAACVSLVDVFTTDNEVKVPTGEEEEDAELDDVDTGSDAASRKSPSLTPGGNKGRKRKSLDNTGGPPKKKGRPILGKRKSGSAKLMDEDEDGDYE